MAKLDDFFVKPADWDTLFPVESKAAESNTFELGVVLGGTVSAGAYTAGVIDFLVEALDAWEAQAKTPGSPNWKVKIKVITGTSGGGVTSTLLARALSFAFPPIRKASSPDEHNNNPFYRIWVKEVSILDMLGTDDLEGSKAPVSLLNPAPLDHSANLIAKFGQFFPALLPKKRAYVDNPLPIFLTLTNLRGIPYQIDMSDEGLTQEYVDHADHVRLAVFSQGIDANYTLRPDEQGVSDQLPQNANGFISWANAAQYALGTSAFPVGFPLRQLSRPISHYKYRPFVIAGEANPVKQGQVKWTEFVLPNTTDISDDYHFLAADGGMMNNEPIELCRQTLAGYASSNPRDGSKANRAVLLVDPFADKAELGPEAGKDLFGSIPPLISSWKDQARYDSRDLLLASNPNVFSRFMITAKRDGQAYGGRSIATACASAFGGFLDENFRRHDFLLGRKNCQDFLLNSFCVYKTNPLVKDWADAESGNPLIFIDKCGKECVRLIPLYGNCAIKEEVDPYPTGRFIFPPVFNDALKLRIDKLIDSVKDNDIPANWYEKIYLSPIIKSGKDKLLEKTINWFKASLSDWNL